MGFKDMGKEVILKAKRPECFTDKQVSRRKDGTRSVAEERGQWEDTKFHWESLRSAVHPAESCALIKTPRFLAFYGVLTPYSLHKCYFFFSRRIVSRNKKADYLNDFLRMCRVNKLSPHKVKGVMRDGTPKRRMVKFERELQEERTIKPKEGKQPLFYILGHKSPISIKWDAALTLA